MNKSSAIESLPCARGGAERSEAEGLLGTETSQVKILPLQKKQNTREALFYAASRVFCCLNYRPEIRPENYSWGELGVNLFFIVR